MGPANQGDTRKRLPGHTRAMAAGQQRVVFPAGANRDPNAFTDPDTFDIGRSPNPHPAFSAGAHFCLGAPLARLHGEVTIHVLLERLPTSSSPGSPSGSARYRSACPSISRSPGARPVSELVMDTAGRATRGAANRIGTQGFRV